MTDDVQYVENWSDQSTQCQNCKLFQIKDDKKACVPEGSTFEEAIAEFGQASPIGHCNYFEKK